jgi:small subunit ribosomal protein S3
MGQKVHPYGFRLGVTKTWRSRWFAKQDYSKLLHEDLDLKELLRERLKAAGISSIEVDRPGNKLRITIRTSRPGIIIGRKGAEIEKLKQDLAKKTKRDIFIDIQEVHKPELDAQLVSESIALQLEKRVAFRRAMRKAVDSALRFGCKGIKVRVSGRLNGAEIARSEWYLQGQLPLHTLRADIDYGFAQAYTTFGVIGVKCWTYKGEILDSGPRRYSSEPEPRRQPPRERRDRDRDRRPAPLAGAPAVGVPTAGGPPAAESGPAVQAPPTEMGHPARTAMPIVPPLTPPQPAWKQEVRPQEVKPQDVEPQEVKPQDVKPQDVRPQEVKPQDVEPQEVKPEAGVPAEGGPPPAAE